MAKAPILAAILALLVLVACSDPAPTAVVAPTAIQQPQETVPVENQPEQTQPSSRPTLEPTMASIPRPTEVPTTASVPTETAVPATTAKPDPTATAVPTPTPTATQATTSTPTPAATTAPTPTLTPITTPIPAPTGARPYDADEYHYSPSVEPRIVGAQGGIYGPYTGTWFETIKETDIEHIVARSEAHDSGLCAATAATRKKFASDLLNLTLASPSVNRHQKSANDIAEWLPGLNQCWYVDRTLQVRREYGLTIDRAEADAVDRVLTGCQSTDMIVLSPGTTTTATATPTRSPQTPPVPSTDVDALALWDDNGNVRITCAETRAHGVTPVHRGHPAYQYMRDADGDGIVCE